MLEEATLLDKHLTSVELVDTAEKSSSLCGHLTSLDLVDTEDEDTVRALDIIPDDTRDVRGRVPSLSIKTSS